MEKFVVRICRRDPQDPRRIAGTVECSAGRGRKGFVNSEGLVNILTSPPQGARAKGTDGAGNSATGKEAGSFSEMVERIRVELDGPEV